MNNSSLTIAICARNAAGTIQRAILSLMGEPHCPLILVDDHCTDNTVALARQVAGDRLQVITCPGTGGVSAARQTALQAMRTPYSTWLDADDEWIPGRAGRLLEGLQNADIATEPIELYDGPTGKYLRLLESPAFLEREKTPARLFERNYLACDTQVGFRVSTFLQAGGYDPGLDRAESYDILLRAIAQKARFHYGRTPGYKMYAYPGSLSRQIDQQKAATARALAKHSYDSIRQLCLYAGEPARVAAWVLVSVALYRGEPLEALRFIDEASPANARPEEILETDGPLPVAEGWRRAFQRGTVLLLAGQRDAEAAQELQKAQQYESTAEGANNLGVAYARLGQHTAAQQCFAQAQVHFPGYLDAKLNAAETAPVRITTHPLRRQASRSEYSAPAIK